MSKIFNITGKCNAEKHYMADISKKLEYTFTMVERGDYFIINRPRQYGKTTILFAIEERVMQEQDYIVFNITFEGLNEKSFENEERFISFFTNLLIENNVENQYVPKKELNDAIAEVDNPTLNNIIKSICKKINKKIILIIDEVDKSTNNQLFLGFLGALRASYLNRERSHAFHSVILAGVHDVKSLKLKLRPNEEEKLNSPWNIAADYNVNMNLQIDEIKPMLADYCQERGVAMNIDKMAEHLFYYTSGYPFLVSKLCKMLDEELLPNKEKKEWTETGLERTVQQLLKHDNTNFENVFKNLENNPALYRMTEQILMNRSYYEFSYINPTVKLGILHGILKNGDGVKIHNIIYEELIYEYMSSKARTALLLDTDIARSTYELPNKILDMERVLIEFQTFMKEQYSKKDRDFLEKHGRLVFLAFLRPILAGAGYDFKEVQISEERRLDVVITYYDKKYIAEMKIWRGEKAHKEGIKQLVDYLNKNNQERGYLIIFDHSEVKEWSIKRIRSRGKKIYTVWV